jgi:hypothetical protein
MERDVLATSLGGKIVLISAAAGLLQACLDFALLPK